MSPTVTLKTYFRAADDEPTDPLGPTAYVAGFEDQNGEPWGMTIRLGSEDVEPVVLADARFSISVRQDGSLLIDADGLSDAAIDRIFEETATAQATIDALVRDTLRPGLLAMEDNPKADLKKLRGQLRDALALVEEALRNLE